MKFTYFQYEFKNFSGGSTHRLGLHEYLRAFCNHDDIVFKNQFVKDGENLYLIPLGAQLFGFVQTRSRETISKINRSDLSHSNIYESLLHDEGLGFISYVFVDADCFAFGTTLLAPRVNAFAEFMDMLLKYTRGGMSYEFTPRAILRESTKAEVMQMQVVGRTAIQVEPGNVLFSNFRNFFGGTVHDYEDVDSFEIIIRPKGRKDIKNVVTTMLDAVSDDDNVRKMVVKAKEHADHRLEELYLAGRGHLADVVEGNASSVGSLVRTKMSENQHLSAKRRESQYETEADQQTIPPFITDLDGGTRAPWLLSLPMDEIGRLD